MDRSWPGYHGLLSLQDPQDFTSLPAHSRLLSDPDDSHAQEQGDVMLSRVMSAEEFIKRMNEVDMTLQSSLYDWGFGTVDRSPESVQSKLGIRCHLQEELLRIMEMMTWDDATCQMLAEHRDSYPRAIDKLVELHENSEQITSMMRSLPEQEYTSLLLPPVLPPDREEGDPGEESAREAIHHMSLKATQDEHSFALVSLKDCGDPEQQLESLTKTYHQKQSETAQVYAEKLLESTDGDNIVKDSMKLMDDHLCDLQLLHGQLSLHKQEIKDAMTEQSVDVFTQSNQSEDSLSDGNMTAEQMIEEAKARQLALRKRRYIERQEMERKKSEKLEDIRNHRDIEEESLLAIDKEEERRRDEEATAKLMEELSIRREMLQRQQQQQKIQTQKKLEEKLRERQQSAKSNRQEETKVQEEEGPSSWVDVRSDGIAVNMN